MMNLITSVVVVIVFALGLGVAVFYNRLVRYRNLVAEAWSGIDVQLKRRADLIPSLLETVRGYAGFERTLLEEITQLRVSAHEHDEPKLREDDENGITRGLKTVFAIAEAYPQLQADRSFLHLQRQLAEVEDQIQYARRYYNGAARDHNIASETFPGNIVAGAFGFTRVEFFEIETATERHVPHVNLGQDASGASVVH